MKKHQLHLVGILLLAVALLSGCAIKINGTSKPYPDEPGTRPPKQTKPPKTTPSEPTEPTNPPPPVRKDPPVKPPPPEDKGLIQGYATLTFYPEEVNVKKGLLGGYILLFDEPQKARDPFSEVAMNTCLYSEHKNTGRPGPAPYSGLNLGKQVSLSTGTQTWSYQQTWMNEKNHKEGYFYNLPSVQDLYFPFLKPFSFKSSGSDAAKPFSFQAQSPPMLKVDAPLMKNEGTLISMNQDLPLRWKLEGQSGQFVVRINQSNQELQLTRSLTCRFSNTGSAVIPSEHWKRFERDEDASRTSLFVFSGKYTRVKVDGYSAPIFAVLESINYTPVIFQ